MIRRKWTRKKNVNDEIILQNGENSGNSKLKYGDEVD